MDEDHILIKKIQKKDQLEDNLKKLVEKHSGIYLDMVNKYARMNCGVFSKEDLVDEKEANIYKCAIKYDFNKNAKFSTFLGNETRWMCLNLYNKNKISNSFIEIDSVYGKFGNEEYEDKINLELSRSIKNIIEQMPDKRIKKIFDMRYVIGEKNSVMPWRKICKEVDLSIQGCINVHDRGLKIIRDKLKKEFT